MRHFSHKKNTASASNDLLAEKKLLIEASNAAVLSRVEAHVLPASSTGSHSNKTRTQPAPSPTRIPQSSPFEIYIAYTRNDERFFQKIKEQLDILQRQGWPISCHESEIIYSTAWQESDHLATANLILLLVSPTFLNSDFCYCDQMYFAVERHRTEKLCWVIPIILHPVHHLLLEGTPFGKLDFLPTNRKALSTWSNPQLGYQDITGYILDKIRYMAYYR